MSAGSASRSSLQSRLAGPFLRLTVRRNLARATDPVAARARFLTMARWLMPDPPLGVFLPDRLGRVPALWASVAGTEVAAAVPRVILYVHGGAFVMGSPRVYRALAARLAAATGGRALVPHYRRAPEHPFPAALEDALAVYAALLERGYPARRIVLAGDSAGGAIALGLAGEVLRQGWPAPAGMAMFSPLVDLTFSGASWQENRARDPMLPARRGPDMAAMWLQGADPRDPRASPLFAAWSRRPPPALIFAAESELLRDDAVRMVARLKAAGGRAELRLAGDLPHVWPFMCPWLPEGCETIAQAGAFLGEALDAAGNDCGTHLSQGASDLGAAAQDQPRPASRAPTIR